MAVYEIEWKHSAEKELRDIDKQYILRITDVVDSLANNPFPPQHRKLRGGESSYRIRVGDYCVIYQVDLEKKFVTIYHVRHRRDAYRK
jgi:mRNA interferase RelE/StbE